MKKKRNGMFYLIKLKLQRQINNKIRGFKSSYRINFLHLYTNSLLMKQKKIKDNERTHNFAHSVLMGNRVTRSVTCSACFS